MVIIIVRKESNDLLADFTGSSRNGDRIAHVLIPLSRPDFAVIAIGWKVHRLGRCLRKY